MVLGWAGAEVEGWLMRRFKDPGEWLISRQAELVES